MIRWLRGVVVGVVPWRTRCRSYTSLCRGVWIHEWLQNQLLFMLGLKPYGFTVIVYLSRICADHLWLAILSLEWGIECSSLVTSPTLDGRFGLVCGLGVLQCGNKLFTFLLVTSATFIKLPGG